MKQIVDQELVLIAEVDDRAIGFAMTLPDINQALIHLKGRLLPTGLLKLLWHTKISNKVDGLRVATLGVIPEYRKRGIDSLMYHTIYKRAGELGYKWGEFSWVLETNELMAKASEQIGGKLYKRYRLDLFIDLDETRQKVDVENQNYVMDAVLGDLMAEDKIIPGDGNVGVITIGTRWKASGKAELAIVGFDEYLRMQIYLELPLMPKPDSLPLVGKSVAQMLGRYDQSPVQKTFIAKDGFYRIDSIASRDVFITLQGDYANNLGKTVSFEGQFRF